MLTDGRIAAVEYREGHLVEDEDAKTRRMVGEPWAEANVETCILDMPPDRDFSTLDRKLSGGA